MASDAVEVVADATGCIETKRLENLLYTRVLSSLLLFIYVADIITNVLVLAPFVQSLVSSCDDGATGLCSVFDTYDCTDVVQQALEAFEISEGVSFLPGAFYNFGVEDDKVAIPNYKNETPSVFVKALVPEDFNLQEHTFGFNIVYDNGFSTPFSMNNCGLVSSISAGGDACLSGVNNSDVIVTRSCFYTSNDLVDNLGVSIGQIPSYGSPAKKIPLGVLAFLIILGLVWVSFMSLYCFTKKKRGILNFQTVVERWLISFNCLQSMSRDEYKAELVKDNTSSNGSLVGVVGLMVDVFIDLGSFIIAVEYWNLFSSTKVSGDLLAEIAITLSVFTLFSLSIRGVVSLFKGRPKHVRVLALVFMAGCLYAIQVLVAIFLTPGEDQAKQTDQSNLAFGARGAIFITLPFTACLLLLQIIHVICFEESFKPESNKIDNAEMNSFL